ncbi:MAG: hypothetical protein OEZ01_04440 [Candidatus Heimdallarchaeota archaeon]|nr:hypothetical protein [Candidatus Heimdallarchaeota archaeon]MDH5645230.1 hypothetical protein [Candidatus Heimdallarchaeota archaeon]
MTENKHIFKIAILCHDTPLYMKLKDVFGVEFEKSYTNTNVSAFAYSHFFVDNQRLTAQFWMLDANPQWAMIRNIYLKGASGIILLIDSTKKKAIDLNNRLLKEFVSVNRFPVPIILFSLDSDNNLTQTKKVVKDLERWNGFKIPLLELNSKEEISNELNGFMRNVRDWRARNVIFQTLKVYFALDAISNRSRSIQKILTRLRQIYTYRYYDLLDDESIIEIIQQAAIIEGYHVDLPNKKIEYTKNMKSNPWENEILTNNNEDLQLKKPTVTKLD